MGSFRSFHNCICLLNAYCWKFLMAQGFWQCSLVYIADVMTLLYQHGRQLLQCGIRESRWLHNVVSTENR